MTSDRFKQIIMENVFKVSSPSYSIPTTYYLGLSTSTAASGEPASTTGYARISLASKLTYDGTNKVIKSNADITFDNSAGSSNWFAAGSPAAYYIICDSSTVRGGNVLAYGSLETSKPILAGDTAKIASGGLQISISDVAS